MTYEPHWEDIRDYILSFPEAQVGPWEDTAELLCILDTMDTVLGLRRIEVMYESVEFADKIRVHPNWCQFDCAQVAAIMTYFSGDNIAAVKTLDGDYIEIWWD